MSFLNRSTTMAFPRPLFPALSLAPVFLLLACGGSGDASASNEGGRVPPLEQAAPAPQAASQERPVASRQSVAQQPPSSGLLFDRELGRARCELLTAEMVAEVTGASVGEMRQTAAPGICSYTWGDGSAELVPVRKL
jgi:hypothetical protein